jgi:hypothetical protein
VVDNLVESGYLNKVTRVVDGGHPTNEYSTNYDALLERVSNGEEIRPPALKKRGKAVVNNGGESAPIVTTIENGGESAPISVVKGANIGGESAPNKDIDSITKDYYSSDRAREACPVQQEEKQEFYKIFFLKNAADPAAEVKRFIAINTSRGWSDRAGNKFDTPEKRRALAELWKRFEFGTGRVKVECGEHSKEATDNYLEFVRLFHERSIALGEAGTPAFVDFFNPNGTFSFSGTSGASVPMSIIKVSAPMKEWICSHAELTRQTLLDAFGMEMGGRLETVPTISPGDYEN